MTIGNDTENKDAAAIATWPRAIFALAVAAHAVMFFSLFFGYLNPLFDNSDQQRQAIDFFSIYQGGTRALHGGSIYSWDLGDSVPYAAPYRYLPFLAYTGAAAFNALPPWSAYWLWVSLIEVMLFANAWLTYQLAADRRWGWIAAAMWFAFTPLYLEEYMGQWSFLMATLMLWTAAPLIRGRPSLAGVPWGVSVLIKTNSALLGPIFLRLRQWRVLAATVAALVLFNAPYFLMHDGEARYFWNLNFGLYSRDVPRIASFMGSGDLGGYSLMRAVWVTFDLTAQDTPRWLVRAVISSVVSVSLASTFMPRRPDVVALFAIWPSVFFLVYSLTWEHHYVMLMPALAMLVALSPRHRATALMVFVFVALPTPYWVFQHEFSPPSSGLLAASNAELFWPRWAAIMYHGSKVVPVLALWVALCSQQIGERRAEHAGSRLES
ncbi:MAG: DUF2029 domain-containing protein [Chloroflexota bacterium]|nr:DUF2029 domain-containing protein [Chloroflexota bacterium]